MERYNPFAADAQVAESPLASRRQQSRGSNDAAPSSINGEQAAEQQQQAAINPTTSRYTTSFPDPFGDDDQHTPPVPPAPSRVPPVAPLRTTTSQPHSGGGTRAGGLIGSGSAGVGVGAANANAGSSNRSNSVTFLHKVGTSSAGGGGDATDETGVGGFGSPQHHRSAHPIQRGGRQASGGFTSFLSRATSVTSSSVTDRVSSTLGSMRGAVDSLSSQFQVGGASQDIAQVAGAGGPTMALDQRQQEQSATICRQRVVLILDEAPSRPGGIDWAAQFNAYRRLVRGLPPQSSLGLSSFFTSSSGGGFTLGSFTTSQADPGADLIEQVSLRDISVLANQTSGAVAVQVSGSSGGGLSGANTSSSSPALPAQLTSRLSLNLGGSGSGGGGGTGSESQQQSQSQYLAPGAWRIVRPEFVVVRQRGCEHLEHLKGIVGALDYCLVPTFEPHEVWSTFQSRQMIFAKLLRVQRRLGKEQFPLIPQVFCQTHRDLVSYIQNSGSNISLPCLVRTGPLGRGKIRVDNLQMLRDFATIMATSEQSCAIEQHLEVKCDLVVQRLGTSLKLFKRNNLLARKSSASGEGLAPTGGGDASCELYGSGSQIQPQQKQSASRQTSLGAGVLSSFMSTGGGGQQTSLQQSQAPGSRRSSNPSHNGGAGANNSTGFEKLADVNSRYRQWVEAIASEFDNKLEAFCIKVAVATNDREYIVGLRNCSMNFLGSQENQDEDRRSFVELVISKMNTILPKHQPVSREVSRGTSGLVRRTSSGCGDNQDDTDQRQAQMLTNNNRSRSVSINQPGEQVAEPSARAGANPPTGSASAFDSGTATAAHRRSSERTATDSPPSYSVDDDLTQDQKYSRQFSLGQSFFDQTSTALSSFQRQSMSFLKRLDARTGSDTGSPPTGAGAPPLSAKSDLAFDRNFGGPNGGTGSLEIAGGSSAPRANNIKSASMDVSQQQQISSPKLTGPPPKPPPPPPSALSNRQSSLASYSSSSLGGGGGGGGGSQSRAGQRRADSTAAAPSSNLAKFQNPMTPQNSLSQSPFSAGSSRQDSGGGSGELRANGASKSTQALPTSQRLNQRVIRQNSALSAFEPFDPSLRSESTSQNASATDSPPVKETATPPDSSRRVSAGGGGKYGDTVSVKSGNSNTSEETTTAEDTMNNLKKTFASIFGDKCE